MFWDNASWHKREEIKDFLKENNGKFLYFVTYSKDLNLIKKVQKPMKIEVFANRFINNL